LQTNQRAKTRQQHNKRHSYAELTVFNIQEERISLKKYNKEAERIKGNKQLQSFIIIFKAYPFIINYENSNGN